MSTFKKFYQYLFRYPGYFLGYLAFSFIARCVNNLHPFFFKWITQAVTLADYTGAVRQVVYLGLSMFVGTLSHTSSWFLGDRGIVKSATDLQIDVMKKIHALDFSYHTEKSSGKLISIMKRGEDAFFNMFEIINEELFTLLINFGFLLFAFGQLGPKYTLISLAVIILSATFGTPILKVNLKRRTLMNHNEDLVTAARVDNLVNFDTVKYFAKEKYEQLRLRELLTSWNRSIQSFLNTYRLMDLSIGNFSNLAIVAIFLLAISDLGSGHLTVADFVLVVSFSTSFFPKLIHGVMVFRNGAKRFSDLEMYFKVLDEPVLVKDPVQPSTLSNVSGQISFDHVNFAYNPANPVFTNFSLTIEPGEAVALVGLSGSGKTTFLKLLMRMYDISSGKISIDGQDITQFSKTYLRSLIGIVPQDPLMFNNTLRYNVSYANAQASTETVWSALQLAKLDEFVKSLPQGLDTQVGERGIKLSGGQRQRLAIARVLLERARIIALDEATSSLDSESEGIVQEAFWNLIKNPSEPRTSVIIAHRLSTVMRSDRIIVLDKGQIVETGSHRQLLRKKSGLYHHLWHLQQNGFLGEKLLSV